MTIENGIKSLVDLAGKRGYITHVDVNNAFPDRSLSAEEWDEIRASLRNLEIEIVDQTDRSMGSGI